jgi:hypothetical protein
MTIERSRRLAIVNHLISFYHSLIDDRLGALVIGIGTLGLLEAIHEPFLLTLPINI